MVKLTNEILMAYADGELDPADRAEVDIAIRMDPEIGRRLEIFLATGAPIAGFFEPLLDEPVPEHLVRLVRDDAGHGQRNRTVVPFPGVMKSGNSYGGSRLALVAASLVTIIAAATSVLYLNQAGGDSTELAVAREGKIFAQGPLKTVLETAPSGTKVALEGDASAMTARMILTFRNRNQSFCRQYEVGGPSDGYSGVACRDLDGEWQVEMHIATSPGPQPDTGERIAPAGGTASDVEAAVSNVIDGDALGRDEEQALIARNWQLSE